MAAGSSTWITAVGDLNPTVLAIQLNANLAIAGDILCKIHRLPNGEERCTTLQCFGASLRKQAEHIWTGLCVDELFHHTVIDIILEAFICGIPKTEFCGPQFGFVRSLLSEPRFLLPNCPQIEFALRMRLCNDFRRFYTLLRSPVSKR